MVDVLVDVALLGGFVLVVVVEVVDVDVGWVVVAAKLRFRKF